MSASSSPAPKPVLRPHPTLGRPSGPLLVVVMDGIGVGRGDEFDAVARARMPTLDSLMTDPRRARLLRAHGRAVGLPSDKDMGNSEVGHNALGSGQIVLQGAARVNEALKSGALFADAAWQEIRKAFLGGGTLHLIGLLSDGGVHSRFDQLERLLEQAAREGAKRIRLHALMDGRDVPDRTAHEYADRIEAVLSRLREVGVDARIASGGGRMRVTMDRYEADWTIVERGWRAHVLGEARHFPSARAAIEKFREEQPGISDQELPAFVVVDGEGGEPIGTIEDGDAVVLFNFRGDRAIELSRAFDDAEFSAFDRVRVPRVVFAGMTEYDGDLHVPRRFLVSPPEIENTSGELLARAGIRSFACSETQKFGHVTYFWNGNRSGAFDTTLETYLSIPSAEPPFSARPEMRASEIAAAAIEALTNGRFDLVRVNLANADMVGHTGDFAATVKACEAVDAALTQMIDAVNRVGGIYVVTSDHGKAEDMALRDKQGVALRDERGEVRVRTSHTLAPVPLVIGGSGLGPSVTLSERNPEAGLANVAATLVNLLGFEALEFWEQTLLSRA